MKLFHVRVLCEREPRKHRQEIKCLKVYAEGEEAAVNMAVNFVRNILDLPPEGFTVREAQPGIVDWDGTSKTLREVAEEEFAPLSAREVAA